MLLLAGHVYETQYLDAPADNVPAGVSCRVAMPTIKTTLIVTNSPTSGVGGRNTTCQQLQLLIYNKNKWIQVPSFGTKITNIDVRLTRELKCLRGPRSGGGRWWWVVRVVPIERVFSPSTLLSGARDHCFQLFTQYGHPRRCPIVSRDRGSTLPPSI